MAPRDWDEFIGQEHLVSPGSLLRRAIEADRLGSSIFFGPPGTGKTALARLAARKSQAAIEYVNAVTAGVAELRNVVKRAIDRKRANGQRTLLIVDEIHHFNRSQQDSLLPDVERGNLTLVGLTTENPYFYVNTALMSRSTAFEFKPLSDAALNKIWTHALNDAERGLGKYKTDVSDDALNHFIRWAEGDARRLLNALELAVTTTPTEAENLVRLDLAVAQASTQRRPIRYDKTGDEHYDTISAFIKSMRGSDPDAALYWLAKMIHGGEDPRFIARRIVVHAAEDVGLADPMALVLANAAFQAAEFIGWPEARIPIAEATIYIATANKSNSVIKAIDAALEDVKSGRTLAVPEHLRDGHYKGAKTLGHGAGYQYAHDGKDHFVPQDYLGAAKRYYDPTEQGVEKKIKERLDNWRKQNQAALDSEAKRE